MASNLKDNTEINFYKRKNYILRYEAVGDNMATYRFVDWTESFKKVTLNPENIAKLAQFAIKLFEDGESLTIADFTFGYDAACNIEAAEAVEDYLGCGMSLFDAIVFSWATKGGQEVKAKALPKDLNIEEHLRKTAVGLYYLYFMGFTQANSVCTGGASYLVKGDDHVGQINKAIQYLGTCAQEKLPINWIQHVDLSGINGKLMNRLSLGMAGTRYLNAFLSIPKSLFKAGAEDEKRFQTILSTWTQGVSWWDLHPLYRSPAFVNFFKSFDDHIKFALYKGVREDVIKKMEDSKMVHPGAHIKTFIPAYTSWTVDDLPVLRNRVFQ